MDKLPELKEGLVYALDASEYGGPIEDYKWRQAYVMGFRLAVIQAWGGGPIPGGKNTYCLDQLSGARKAGLMTAIYFVLPANTTIQTHLFIPVLKQAAGPEYEYIKFVAVDIEGDKPLHPLDPKARLHDAISHIEDKPVVIYTSRNMWSKVIGDVTGFEQYALWDACYDKTPELDTNWVPYGGWKQRAMKQYKGTTDVGGISADQCGKPRTAFPAR